MAAEVKLTVLVPEDLRRKAKTLASAQGITISDIVRAALEQFIAVAAYELRKRDPNRPRAYAGLEPELAAEFSAWDAASDEALMNFEMALN
jgi:antitoxin component of RelBE/YafQ-DinJ toxin-antitoxin module